MLWVLISNSGEWEWEWEKRAAAGSWHKKLADVEHLIPPNGWITQRLRQLARQLTPLAA